MHVTSKTVVVKIISCVGILVSGGCDLASPDPGSGNGTIAPESTAAPPATGIGGDTTKWDLWSSGQTRLRGADLHPCALFDEEDNVCRVPIGQQDVQDLRDMGANVINASYEGLFEQQPPYGLDAERQQEMDDLIAWAEDVGIYVVINARTGPGRNEAAIQVGLGLPTLTTVWTDRSAHDAWIDMWRYMADRYADSPVVIGYDLMVEPHVNTWVDPNGALSPTAFQEQHAGTLADWNAFAQEITTAIREVDSETPIVIDSLSWASASWFPALRPTTDARTIYSPHFYDPDTYVSQESQSTDISYPSTVVDAGERIEFNREWLATDMEPVVAFSRGHDVPIYVGEFGAFRWVPGGAAFIADEVELFEESGWNYAYYVWRGDVVGFDAFNAEFGSDSADTDAVAGNPLLGAYTAEWSRNTDYPVIAE